MSVAPTENAPSALETDGVLTSSEPAVSGTEEKSSIVGGVPVGSTFGVASNPVRFHGFTWLTLNLPPGLVISSSTVTASICELNGQGLPTTGSARMTVHNVVPTNNNSVVILAENSWGSDLPTRFMAIIKN